MLRSMTGYGKSQASIVGKNYAVEIRSLNSKYLDLSLKIPPLLREKELELRNLISESIFRGKVELLIEAASSDEKSFSVNKRVFRQYYSELESLAKELNDAPTNLFTTVLNIPDVLSTGDEKLNDEAAKKLLDAVAEAASALDKFRKQEGRQLADDIMMRVKHIAANAGKIKATEGGRKEAAREKLRQKVEELIASKAIDENRFEQELVYYAERLDITEELVRLDSHCSYFLEVADDKEISKGKKLGFIAQEMGREVNTIGSKANDAMLQKIVVEMKEDLEKIKEQVNNVL